jgi:hypothetical protein
MEDLTMPEFKLFNRSEQKGRQPMEHEVNMGESKKRVVPRDAKDGEVLRTFGRLTCDSVAAFAEYDDGTREIVLTHVRPDVHGFAEHRDLLERDLPKGKLREKRAVIVTTSKEGNPTRGGISALVGKWLGGKPKVVETSGMIQAGVDMDQQVIVRAEPSGKSADKKGFFGVAGTSNWEDIK